MSFWNSAIGAMIGFTLGGPLGALIGGVLGSRFGKSNSAFNINKNQQHQVAFFTALFACFAKLAKADGIVTKEEIRSIDFVIKNKLKFNSEQRALAIRVFNQAKEDKNSFEDYASQLSSLLKENPNALLFFYELLFELAISDKLLHKNEEYMYSKDKRYLITAGNAGNLLISFGGNILGKLGKKGEVVESLEITTDLF